MRFNPCGQGVDWIKYPYVVPCQFNRDAQLDTRIVWTVAHENAPALIEGSRICNLALEVDKSLYHDPVGETWDGYGRVADWRTTPAGVNGERQCGPDEYFMHGGESKPDDPPQEYGAYGYPVCCFPPTKLRGGAGGGGRVKLIPYIDPAKGGVEIGGQAGDRFTMRDGAAGGVEIGGTAGDVYEGPDAAQGGVQIGGQAGDVFEFPEQARGGVEIGGQAGDRFAADDPAQGGAEIGGQAGDRFKGKDGAAGGVEIGGQAGDRFSSRDGAAGGVEIGGQAGDRFSTVDQGAGGVEIGGEAGDDWTPGGVTPGTTCGTAGMMELDTPVNVFVPMGMDSLWLKFPIDPANPYHVSIVCNDGSPTVTVWDGADCSHRNFKFELTSTGCEFTFTDFTTGWLEIHQTMFGDYHVQCTVGAGMCP